MKRHTARPRVLAFHAPGATPEMWEEVAAAAPELDLIAPDLLALSHAVGGRLGPMLRALAAMVPQGPVILTGCTLGANIALEIAALLGPRAQGVLLLAPQPARPVAGFRDKMRQLSLLLAADMGPDEAAAWAPLLVHRASRRGRAALGKAEAMLREAYGAAAVPLVQLAADFPEATLALRRMKAPVRALFGAEAVNPFPGPTLLPDWRKAIGADNVEVLPDCKEWIALEDPALVAAELRELAALAVPELEREVK